MAIQIFDNIEALQAASFDSTVKEVQVLGYYTPGFAGHTRVLGTSSDFGAVESHDHKWWRVSQDQVVTYSMFDIWAAKAKWQANVSVVVGEVFEPIPPTKTLHYRVKIGGTTGGSEPNWGTSDIAESTGVTWTPINRNVGVDIKNLWAWAAARGIVLHDEPGIYRIGSQVTWPDGLKLVRNPLSRYWRDRSYETGAPGEGGKPLVANASGRDYVDNYEEIGGEWGVDPEEVAAHGGGNTAKGGMARSRLTRVGFRGTKGIAVLNAFDHCVLDQCWSRGADQRPGGSGFRALLLRHSTVRDCDFQGDDDTGSVCPGQNQQYTLDADHTPCGSEGGLYDRCRFTALQGSIAGFISDASDSTVGSFSPYSKPLEFVDGADYVKWWGTAFVSHLAVGSNVKITGVTNAMVAGYELEPSDINGNREIVQVGEDVANGDRVLHLSIGKSATGSGKAGDSGVRVQFLEVSTANASKVVTIRFPDHGLASGRTIKVLGWTDGFAGISAAEANGQRTVTRIDDAQFSFEADHNATQTTSHDRSQSQLAYIPILTGSHAITWRDCTGTSGDSTETGNGGQMVKLYNYQYPDGAALVHDNPQYTHGDNNTGLEARQAWHIKATVGPIKLYVNGGRTYKPNGRVVHIEQDSTYFTEVHPGTEAVFKDHVFDRQRGSSYSAFEADGGSLVLDGRCKITLKESGASPYFKLGKLSGSSMKSFFVDRLELFDVGDGKLVFDIGDIEEVHIRRLIIHPADGATGIRLFRYVSTLNKMRRFVVEDFDFDGAAGDFSVWHSATHLANLRNDLYDAGQRCAPIVGASGFPYPVGSNMLSYDEFHDLDVAGFGAAKFTGQTLTTSDGNAGNPGVVVSNGTNWRTITTSGNISTT